MLTTEKAAFCTCISMSSVWLMEEEYEQSLFVYEIRMYWKITKQFSDITKKLDKVSRPHLGKNVTVLNAYITIKYCSLIQYLKLRQALNLPSIYVKKSIYIKALCCILFHLPKERNSLLFKIHSFNPILVLWEEFFPGWSSLLLSENLCQMK